MKLGLNPVQGSVKFKGLLTTFTYCFLLLLSMLLSLDLLGSLGIRARDEAHPFPIVLRTQSPLTFGDAL